MTEFRLSSVTWATWLIAAMAATLLLYGIDVVFDPLTPAVSELVQQFGSSALFFGATALCVRKGRTTHEERSAWWLLALAMMLWAIGSAYFALVLWERVVVPIPSVADGFWLAFYVPASAALYKLLRRNAGTSGRAVWLDATVAGLGVGGALATLLFGEVLKTTGPMTAATATDLAYPAGDLGLLALVVAVITVVGWKASGVWRWVAFAFAIFAFTDSVYLVEVARGTYAGGVGDLGWPASALMVGFAAWKTEPGVRVAAQRQTTIMVPAICGLAALALLVVDHFARTNAIALGLATASILVIIVRLFLTAQDTTRLLAVSRRDAATDALTGLGNRRRLMADLHEQVAELDPLRPLMLTLYDLDGFKQYNDSFGHLAGDQLLERLSARLAETLEGHGSAYRMGGDEFCTLWRLSDGDQAPVATMDGVAALSEQGEAFSIGCSHGSVLLPSETADPTQALRIADRRMYVRKGSGRVSAGRQSSDVLLRALAERDADLGVHLDGVAQMACATAAVLGVEEQDIEAARHTALLHDVGKFAIPDEIVHKPGPVDDSEWEFMKRHTIIGERIILAAPALTRVAGYVRSTHERYDGTGYPDGLVGHDIPVIARVVAVCDAYDAMMTDRSYRRARERASAIAELRMCAGTQFDPAVVEAFVATLDGLEDSPHVERHAGTPA